MGVDCTNALDFVAALEVFSNVDISDVETGSSDFHSEDQDVSLFQSVLS